MSQNFLNIFIFSEDLKKWKRPLLVILVVIVAVVFVLFRFSHLRGLSWSGLLKIQSLLTLKVACVADETKTPV